MKNLVTAFCFLSLCSCFSDHYKLNDEEKELNPYVVGDIVIMESSKQEIDSLIISEIDLVDNDGLGITEYKQALRVLEGEKPKKGNFSDNRTFLLEIISGGSREPAYIKFRDFQGKKLYLQEIRTNEKITWTTNYGNYNDVINIQGNSNRKYESLIYNIKWSLENGIIEYETGDSIIWTLKKKVTTKK
jgi:hypothetical protein